MKATLVEPGGAGIDAVLVPYLPLNLFSEHNLQMFCALCLECLPITSSLEVHMCSLSAVPTLMRSKELYDVSRPSQNRGAKARG